MKYYHMIKTSKDIHPSGPVIEENKTEVVVSNEEVLHELSSIKEMLVNIKANPAPPEVDNTVMNDDQISEIISYMLSVREKYFPDIQLSKDIPKQFIWNIPPCVYDTFISMHDKEEPDMLNPLFWFTLFCVDLDEHSMAYLLNMIIEGMTEKAHDRIEELNAEFEELNTEDIEDLVPDNGEEVDYSEIEDESDTYYNEAEENKNE